MPRKTFALAREKRIMTKTLKIDFFGSPNLLTASGPLVPPPPTPLLRHYLLCYPRERPLAHNPAGDGHSESMVKAVKQAIRLAIQTDAKHWCMLAKWAAFMYNCSYNSTIGTTPYFCRHGREPRHASDLIFNHPGTTDTVSLSQLVARINKVQASVQASVKAMHQRFIRKNATLNRTRQFKKDDKVWLHRVYPGRTARSANGLGRAWFWPFRPETYRITQKLSAQHVRIKPDDDISNNRSQVVHMRRLKHFKSQDDALDLSIFDRDDLQTVD